MSLANARASFNRIVGSIADGGVPVLYQAHQAWLSECYRVEHFDAEVPRGRSEAARNVRIHIQGPGEMEMELRVERLIQGLELPRSGAGIAVHPLYNYAADQVNPPQGGMLRVERSAAGIRIADPKVADPSLRRFIVSLVLVYQR